MDLFSEKDKSIITICDDPSVDIYICPEGLQLVFQLYCTY